MSVLNPTRPRRRDRGAWLLDAVAGLVGALLALVALVLIVQWCC
ncbi:hypothetical protein [Conexibacter arvalis]|uniref:Uncharacterized protein n=1 Tax=Conexibacter arvalis TaxID=912552 RepID=A0A840IHT0_9ACTN|nr:hypothetical protein [Conexibacter arvalis]MBB4664522.1 hypothetical protein [Conexibacter arvalis]